MSRAYYSRVVEAPASEVWSIIRDFNDDPRFIEGVTESQLEEGKAQLCSESPGRCSERSLAWMVAAPKLRSEVSGRPRAPRALTGGDIPRLRSKGGRS